MSHYIKNIVNDIVKKYNTNNPFELANFLNIKIIYSEKLIVTKGFFKKINRNKFIFLNSNLDEVTCKIVVAHELAHSVLHENENINVYNDALANIKGSRFEYEANIFVSHLLIEDEKLFELLDENLDYKSIMYTLGISYEILIFKLKELNKVGYSFNIPSLPKSKFLKD